MRQVFLVLVIAVTFLLLSNCGSDSTSSENPLGRAMGLIAVTSPTAGTSSSSVTLRGLQLMTGTPDNVKPMTDMVNDVKTVRDGDPTAQAASLGNPLSLTSARAACYGPAWTDNATGSNVNRPTGDLGITYATASNTDTTACVAAELNALLSGTPSLVNNFIKLQGIMLGAANKNGKALPGTSETQDNTTVMPTISGMTISSATLKQLTSASGGEVYKTTFSVKDASNKTGTITIWHAPGNAGNTNFTGLFKAVLPYTSTSSVAGSRGISMVYEQTDGVIKYAMKSSANRATSSEAHFGSDEEVNFNATAYGEDGHMMVAQFNSNTNEAIANYAWQAGNADNSARVFAIYIPAGTSGELTGSGFFGFGADIAAISDNASPWITKMHCNWLNGLAGGASLTKAQKQTIQQSGGKFIVSANAWAFAPTDTCVKSGTFTISGADATFLNGSRSVASHALVAIPTTTDVPRFTLPTFTVPSE